MCVDTSSSAQGVGGVCTAGGDPSTQACQKGLACVNGKCETYCSTPGAPGPATGPDKDHICVAKPLANSATFNVYE